MQFRETLWFKKLPIEAEAEKAAVSDDAPADTLRPIEDRYRHFGQSVPRLDTQPFGPPPGKTRGLPKIFPEGTGGVVRVDESVLAKEFRRMRVWYGLAAAGVLAATVAGLVALV